MKKSLSLLALFFVNVLFGATETTGGPLEENAGSPSSGAMEWASSLLSASGIVIPVNKIQAEIWVIDNNISHAYNSTWDAVSIPHITRTFAEIRLKWGFVKNFDLVVVTSKFLGQSSRKCTIGWGDSALELGYQFYKKEEGEIKRGVRLTMSMIIPTGKYDRFDEDLDTADDAGTGSYALNLGLNAQQTGKIGKHGYRMRYCGRLIIPGEVFIRDVSHFKGAKSTKGTINVGQIFESVLSYDLVLSESWRIGADLQYVHNNRSTFQGQAGSKPDGSPVVVGRPSSERISVAPAIKYVIPSVMRLQLGVWATLAGRNTQAFIGPFFSIEHTY